METTQVNRQGTFPCTDVNCNKVFNNKNAKDFHFSRVHQKYCTVMYPGDRK